MHPKQPRRDLARTLISATIAIGAAGVPSAVYSQTSTRLDLGGVMEVGGEEERYLRALQIAGLAPLTPWAIQPFSPTQVGILRSGRDHPWVARYATDSGRFVILRPRARLVENTTFPYQNGIGPTWEGRGLTGEVQVGVAGSLGPLHLQFAPVAFAAQNDAFRLATNGLPSPGSREDARFPNEIDLPQRFGAGRYSRATLGTSSLTLDAFHVVTGISTAPQKWGPEPDFPLVLGPNAGGFPMAFLGTSTPANLWLFKLNARLMYGRLTDSFEYVTSDSTHARLASAVIASVTPRGMDGLEVGVARFIERYWPSDIWDWSVLKRPFSGVVSDLTLSQNDSRENQLGSVFFRWAFPKNQVEIFGEMYREDYPGPFHGTGASLIEHPDDYSSFALGLQRAWKAPDRLRVLHLEIVNGEINHQERDARGFTQPLPPYIHVGVVQGHTESGMLLGSPEAYGGSGWHFGVDEFTPKGRRSITFERTLQLDWLPTLPADHPQIKPDVLYAVRGEVMRFVGTRDVTFSVAPSFDLNRDLVARRDVFNLSAGITFRGW